MIPGQLISSDEADVAMRCGIECRPWLGSAREAMAPRTWFVTRTPATSLARLSAYRIALIALWPPADDEQPEAHAVRKAEAMAAEIAAGSAAMIAAVERGEL